MHARNHEKTTPTFSFDRETRLRVLTGIRLLFTSEYRWQAIFLSFALIILSLAINSLNVINSYVGRDFISAIELKNTPEFVSQAAIYITVFILSTIAAVFFRFCEEKMGLLCRDWLTRRMVRLYLNNQVYYRIINDKGVENPDQRIADDVKTATTTTLSILLMLLNSFFAVVAFSGVLWTISPTLFIISVAYAMGGSAVTFILGRSLIRLNYAQLDKEANFRSDLIHVREHAESIVLLGRETRLSTRIMFHIDELISNFNRIILVNRNVGFFTTGYNYLLQIIPALVVGPLFIAGKVEFGVVTQSAMAFAHLIGAFSLFITNFQSISNYTAVLARLTGLFRCMEQESEHGKCNPIFHNREFRVNEARIMGLEEDSADEGAVSTEHVINIKYNCNNEAIRYEDLTLHGSNQECLLKNLNLTLHETERLLVIGASESAKLALLRVTAGIFEDGSGTVHRPDATNLVFLPERPYMPPGTFRELIVPNEQGYGAESDQRILDLLKKMEAEHLLARVGGLDASGTWDELFSLTEQQLLACTRLLYAAPRFAILDRTNTALPPEDLSQFLELLRNHGIAYVMIGRTRHGKRDTDDKLSDYDHVLSIEDKGAWRYYPVNEMDP